MQKYQVLLWAILLWSCQKAQIEHTTNNAPSVPWTDTSAIHPKNQQFTDLIEKYRKKGLPGISLLVNDVHGTWVGSTGKADIEKNVPFQIGTVSKAASITKLLVGTLVFRLIEDSASTGLGYNILNTKISQWLPAKISGKLANGNLVTLGQCMKHETGIPDVIDEDLFYLAVLNNPNKKWKPEEILEFVYDKPALFNPSDTAIYSNTNTTLVAMVIEAATGQDHSKLLRQYVLSPLSMNHTFYQPHDELPSYTAQGYFDLYNNNTILNVSNIVTGSGNGYGGVYSNVADLYKFIDALLLKQTFLSAKSLTLMQTWGKPDDPNRYGYGIMKKFISREPDTGIGHSGRDLGYTANLFYFPTKGVTHIFFVNYGTDAKSNLKQVFTEFQDQLIDLTFSDSDGHWPNCLQQCIRSGDTGMGVIYIFGGYQLYLKACHRRGL